MQIYNVTLIYIYIYKDQEVRYNWKAGTTCVQRPTLLLL